MYVEKLNEGLSAKMAKSTLSSVGRRNILFKGSSGDS